jgi:recombination protein RecA
MGVETGFVKKSGSWYTYEGDQLGQGKENSRQFLKDNPQLAAEIETKIKAKLGVGAVPIGEESQEVPEVAPPSKASSEKPGADKAAADIASAVAKEDAPF